MKRRIFISSVQKEFALTDGVVTTIWRKPERAFEAVGGQVTPEVIPPVWPQPESRPESLEIQVLRHRIPSGQRGGYS